MIYILRETFTAVKSVISKSDDPSGASTARSRDPSSIFHYSVMIHINLIRNGERIRPRRELQAMTYPYRHTLIQDAAAELGPNDVGNMTVKALCPDGFVTVEDDATWQHCKKLAAETDWMDGEMKVVVEIT